jgi:hypothetical protein
MKLLKRMNILNKVTHLYNVSRMKHFRRGCLVDVSRLPPTLEISNREERFFTGSD